MDGDVPWCCRKSIACSCRCCPGYLKAEAAPEGAARWCRAVV